MRLKIYFGACAILLSSLTALAQDQAKKEMSAEEKAAFAAAGDAAPGTDDEYLYDFRTYIDYFNKTFETYGRKVVFKDFKSNADSTSEAEGQGKDKACADADAIANQLKAFAETGEEFGSAPFSECAADQKLMELAGGPYYDETWYRRLDPYVWNGVMECERISHQRLTRICFNDYDREYCLTSFAGNA